MPEFSSCSRQWVVVVWLLVVLLWREPEASGRSATTPPSIKLGSGGFDNGGRSCGSPLFSCHGGEEGWGSHGGGCWWLDLRQRRGSSPLGSFPTPTTTASSVYSMAKRRPLPPLAPVTASLGRIPLVVFNLQAFVPLRRPFGFSTGCSRLIAPSGIVPGDDEVACAEALNCGGDGAVLDCFSSFSFEEFCAICKDLLVMLSFLLSGIVLCSKKKVVLSSVKC